MTELQLYSVFIEVIAASELTVECFTALLFGFLVAAYLASPKLDRIMVTIILSLYSIMAIRYSFLFINQTDDVVAIAGELRTMAASPGSSISWLEVGPVDIVFFTGFFS